MVVMSFGPGLSEDSDIVLMKWATAAVVVGK